MCPAHFLIRTQFPFMMKPICLPKHPYLNRVLVFTAFGPIGGS